MTMVNNKQVNFWRGDQIPPTIYHIWIKDNSKMLLFDGTKWVIFLDNVEIVGSIKKILERLDFLEDRTINEKPIMSNPVLDGTDLLINIEGQFISSTDSVSKAISRLNELLTTQIIE